MGNKVQQNFAIRKNFAEIKSLLELPNLIDIQRTSWDKFFRQTPNQKSVLTLVCKVCLNLFSRSKITMKRHHWNSLVIRWINQSTTLTNADLVE